MRTTLKMVKKIKISGRQKEAQPQYLCEKKAKKALSCPIDFREKIAQKKMCLSFSH